MGMISVTGLNTTAGIMTTAAGLLTLGRFIIHWRKNHKFRWDDWFNLLALFFLLGVIIIFEIYVPIEYNAILYAKGLSDRPPTDVEAVRDMKLNIADIILFFCTVYSVKASFLALYWQIFSRISNRFRIAWYGLTGYTVVGFLVSVVTVFIRCGPARYFDNLEKCSERSRALFIGYQTLWCVLNVLGDLLLMILPIDVIKSLHMGFTQKIGLAVVFALVLVIVAMDILRTVYTLAMDLTEGQDANALWGILEPTIAVIVCALPCYRGLLRLNTGNTQNESFWSFGQSSHKSAWSRLFRSSGSSSSVSGSQRSDEKGQSEDRGSSKEGSFITSHV